MDLGQRSGIRHAIGTQFADFETPDLATLWEAASLAIYKRIELLIKEIERALPTPYIFSRVNRDAIKSEYGKNTPNWNSDNYPNFKLMSVIFNEVILVQTKSKYPKSMYLNISYTTITIWIVGFRKQFLIKELNDQTINQIIDAIKECDDRLNHITTKNTIPNLEGIW